MHTKLAYHNSNNYKINLSGFELAEQIAREKGVDLPMLQ